MTGSPRDIFSASNVIGMAVSDDNRNDRTSDAIKEMTPRNFAFVQTQARVDDHPSAFHGNEVTVHMIDPEWNSPGDAKDAGSHLGHCHVLRHCVYVPTP